MKAINQIILKVGVVILALSLIKTCLHKKEVQESFKTTIEEETFIKTDSVQKDSLFQQKEIIIYDTIKKVIVHRVHVNKPILKDEIKKEVFQVMDTLQLSNAKIFSQIIAEGKILDYKVKATTENKVITKTIEKVILQNKNQLYLNFSPLLGFNAIKGAEVSIDYTIKNKIRFGLGVGYAEKSPYATLKIGIPLN